MFHLIDRRCYVSRRRLLSIAKIEPHHIVDLMRSIFVDHNTNLNAEG
jgi:hypothetical protein